MTIGGRQTYYESRGFSEKDAAVCVLIELALQSLSGAFPETFVCFGGATLVLFFGSARVSADLDLLVNGETVPSAQDVIAIISAPLQDAAYSLGLGGLELTVLLSGFEHYKIAASNNSERLFTIDVTKISGTIHTEVVKAPLSIESASSASASHVTPNWTLLQKVEAFLTRRALKVRDAFDIKVLLDSGAALNERLKAHLADGQASERLEDPEFIQTRIAAITPKKCELELRPVLPEPVYAELERSDFAQLRSAAATVLADWLEN